VGSLAAIAILSLSLRRQPTSGRGAVGFSAYNVTLQKLTNTGNVPGASLSPDGQFMVYSTRDEENRGALWLRRVGSKESLQLVPPTPDGIWSFTVSHDNSWIFYVQSDRDEPTRSGTIFRLPILGGTPRKLTEKVDSDVTLSPDDRRMAFDRFKAGGEFDLVTANAIDGSDERVIATSKPNSAKEFLHPQWSPDGTKLAFVSNRVDHSLIGIEASHRIVVTGAIDDLITDSGSLPADRLAFASAGIRVTLADEESEEMQENPAERPNGARKKA